MNIAILSGELSGDLIGGALAHALKRLAPQVELWGLGSENMREAGVELVADSASWGAISITEAVGKIPRLLLKIAPMMRHALKTRRPEVVVLIDFGAFNVRAARFCKEQGLKVCYYFPPGSWRRSGDHGAELARITDVLATPFSFSEERYRRLGANAVTVGHPLLERTQAQMSRAEFAGQFGLDPMRPIIGLLPGSRRHEVSHLMPVLLDASRLIYRQVPDAQFVVGIAPSISPEIMESFLTGHTELRDRLKDLWHDFAQEAETRVLQPMARKAGALSPQGERTLVTADGVLVPITSLQEEMQARRRTDQLHTRAERNLAPTVLIKGLTNEIMAHSDVLLVCSGTATLEAAIFGTPMVILYRGSKIMELEYRLRGIKKKVRHIGLPNILADRTIVPELIQEQATPEAIAAQAIPMLNDIQTRHRVKQDLQEIRALLGAPGASERTARLILDLAGVELAE